MSICLHTHTQSKPVYTSIEVSLQGTGEMQGKNQQMEKANIMEHLNAFVSIQKTATLYRYYETITVRQILAPCLKGGDLQNKEMSMQYCTLATLHWSKRAWALQEEILLTLMYYTINRITLTWYQPTLIFSSQKCFATMLFAVWRQLEWKEQCYSSKVKNRQNKWNGEFII